MSGLSTSRLRSSCSMSVSSSSASAKNVSKNWLRSTPALMIASLYMRRCHKTCLRHLPKDIAYYLMLPRLPAGASRVANRCWRRHYRFHYLRRTPRYERGINVGRYAVLKLWRQWNDRRAAPARGHGLGHARQIEPRGHLARNGAGTAFDGQVIGGFQAKHLVEIDRVRVGGVLLVHSALGPLVQHQNADATIGIGVRVFHQIHG